MANGFGPNASTPNAAMPAAGGITVSGSLPSPAAVGSTVSTTFTASGGTAPYTWSATGLPASWSINASTGVVSGTTTALPGVYAGILITATDALSATGSVSMNVTVSPLSSPQSHAVRQFETLYHKLKKPWRPPPRKRNWVYQVNIASARITWSGVEVVHSGNASARITWSGVEVVHSGHSDARVTWTGVEIVRSIYDTPAPTRPFVRRAVPPHNHKRRNVWYQGHRRTFTAPIVASVAPFKRRANPWANHEKPTYHLVRRKPFAVSLIADDGFVQIIW